MNKKHRFFYSLLRPLAIVFLKLRFGYKFKKAKSLPDHYIVLSNHATDYDPLFVGVSFPRQMYFVSSEHITRWRVAYPLLKYIFAPIIRYKGSVAASTAMDVLRKTKRGMNVCMFAEGVRTWDGVTCPIHPSTVKLIKASKCGLVTYRLSGGYFVSPMWSSGKGMRRGPISGAPVMVYTKEQVARMSEEELAAAIDRDLYENAYETQKASPKKYKGRRLAEGLERFLYLCPSCRAHNAFQTSKHEARCAECGLTFSVNVYGLLENAPFQTVRNFALWQRQKTMEDARSGAVYRGSASLAKIEKHVSIPLSEGELSLSARELRCGELVIPTASITQMAMHGTQALVFSADGVYYELLPKSPDNIIRFLWLYEAFQTLPREEQASMEQSLSSQ